MFSFQKHNESSLLADQTRNLNLGHASPEALQKAGATGILDALAVMASTQANLKSYSSTVQ